MTYEKSVKHNEQNRLSMWLAAVVVGILIVVILVACGGLVSRLHSNNQREVAREKLGLVYEGEVIFKEGTSQGQ